MNDVNNLTDGTDWKRIASGKHWERGTEKRNKEGWMESRERIEKGKIETSFDWLYIMIYNVHAL